MIFVTSNGIKVIVDLGFSCFYVGFSVRYLAFLLDKVIVIFDQSIIFCLCHETLRVFNFLEACLGRLHPAIDILPSLHSPLFVCLVEAHSARAVSAGQQLENLFS